MTTGRRESSQIDMPSPLGVRTKEKSLPASHPCPREEKSGEKNRGGDIMPIRLRRRLRRQPRPAGPVAPARRDRPGPPRPGRLRSARRPQAAAPEARSSCRKEPHRMRGRCGRTSFGPGASRARLGRKSGVGRTVLFAVGAQGSHNQRPPPGPPRPPPSHCLPARNCPELPGIARQKNIAPEQVSAHRPPFSVSLTTSAVSRNHVCQTNSEMSPFLQFRNVPLRVRGLAKL